MLQVLLILLKQLGKTYKSADTYTKTHHIRMRWMLSTKNKEIFNLGFEEMRNFGIYMYHLACYSKFTHNRLQRRATRDIERKAEQVISRVLHITL